MNKSKNILTVLQMLIAFYLLIMGILYAVSSVGILKLNVAGDGLISHMIIMVCAIVNIRPENRF